MQLDKKTVGEEGKRAWGEVGGGGGGRVGVERDRDREYVCVYMTTCVFIKRITS